MKNLIAIIVVVLVVLGLSSVYVVKEGEPNPGPEY